MSASFNKPTRSSAGMNMLGDLLTWGCILLTVSTASAWVSHGKVGTRPTLLCAALNNNVVLRPSTDQDAFDSLKIGSARVHRYKTDGPNGDGTEYVMWYHGRPDNFQEGQSLPPLSTGRIGRAVSLNGLKWKKCTEGSASEDRSDVILGPNKESWWAFDTAHVGLGQVLLPMQGTAVIAEGGIYIMYYMGGDLEESHVADYLENVPSSLADKKVLGMKMRIGVAVSQDGVAWGRVEGEDPTGACMVPYDKTDPNQANIATMRDDDDSLLNIAEELYCAWPEVTATNIGKDSGSSFGKIPNFLMYYSTMTKSDKKKSIACAVSDDGFRWLKRGVCLEPDATGFDAGGCARCNVIKKALFDKESRIWVDGEGWIMFYEGVSKEDNKHRIMAAESEDGRSWKKVGVCLDVGESSDAWDFEGVGSPHVLRMDDGSLRMYYTGQGEGGTTAIGVAKTQPGSAFSWSREQADFFPPDTFVSDVKMP